jgi:predicted tellurium resistance membrane protein TerC
MTSWPPEPLLFVSLTCIQGEIALTTELLIALVTLTLMEIVLGIDNVIFIAIVAARLPKEQQPRARRIGLGVALITRLLLLGMLFFLSTLDKTVVFSWTMFGIPEEWFESHTLEDRTVIYPARDVTVKDLVLLLGGLFLIGKSTMEIHHKLEGDEESEGVASKTAPSFASVITQIALLDIVFSLDSVITAVGMVKADPTKGIDWAAISVMVAAMVIALGVMLLAANVISDFVARHPTIKILALAFLILIGVMLTVEGTGHHINKGYIYFAMAFSVGVEMINLRLRARTAPVKLHEKHMPPDTLEPPPARP